MSFWEDASPVVKGAIVVGILGIIVAAMAFFAVPPFDAGPEEDTTTERGLEPPPGG
jgi:hypothetical protein